MIQLVIHLVIQLVIHAVTWLVTQLVQRWRRTATHSGNMLNAGHPPTEGLVNQFSDYIVLVTEFGLLVTEL